MWRRAYPFSAPIKCAMVKWKTVTQASLRRSSAFRPRNTIYGVANIMSPLTIQRFISQTIKRTLAAPVTPYRMTGTPIRNGFSTAQALFIHRNHQHLCCNYTSDILLGIYNLPITYSPSWTAREPGDQATIYTCSKCNNHDIDSVLATRCYGYSLMLWVIKCH